MLSLSLSVLHEARKMKNRKTLKNTCNFASFAIVIHKINLWEKRKKKDFCLSRKTRFYLYLHSLSIGNNDDDSKLSLIN